MTRDEFVRRYITVHKCIGCDEILDYEYSDSAYCDECLMGWNAALNMGCRDCFKPARECLCMPKRLSRAGALVFRKLFFYGKGEKDLPEMKMIYYLKRKKYKRLSRFVAEQLLPLIKEEIAVLGADKSDVIVTYVPRGTRTRRLYGFDQAYMIAQAVSKKLNIECKRLLKSKISSKSQKDLGVAAREKNANDSIRLRRGAGADGKYVLIVDDIVTSGSSMAACVRLLNTVGARGVLCFSLASEKLK